MCLAVVSELAPLPIMDSAPVLRLPVPVVFRVPEDEKSGLRL